MSWLTEMVGDLAKDLYSEIPSEIMSLYTDPLTQISAPDISFKPFSVTTAGLGSVGTTADGSTTFNLSPEQKALQDQLFGGASSMFASALGPTADRETDLYNKIRALQMPEEERQQMGLEERLASQGRLGVTTNQYGGTPEQLALSKAQSEARNAAALQALTQSQQMQQQDLAMAGQLMQQGYAPQANLLNALSGGMGVASMADVARRQQGQYGLEADVANLQGLIGQQQGLANLFGGIYGNVLGGVGGLAQGAASGLFDWLTGL